MDKQEFINMIAANVKTKQWLNGTFDVNGKRIGIKAYGKWVQRMQVSWELFYIEIPEQKTIKALKAALDIELNTLGVH